MILHKYNIIYTYPPLDEILGAFAVNSIFIFYRVEGETSHQPEG